MLYISHYHFLITQRNEYRGSSYTSWWHALSSLDTPGKLNYCTSTAFPQKQKEKKGDNCLPAIRGWEVIQPTGKTQVFNDAKRCLILPSFSPGEWYFQSLDFSPPHCKFQRKETYFEQKKNETLRLKTLQLTQCLISQFWKAESGFTCYKEREGVLKLFFLIISAKQI